MPISVSPTAHQGGNAGAAEPPLLDVRGVAALLGCSTRHVARLKDAGKLPTPLRLGTLLRWRRATLDQGIAGGCRPCR